MSIISDVFAGGAEGILKGIKDVASIFKADPLEVMRLQAAIAQTEATLASQLSSAQTKVNEIEAASSDKFVSRWRPAIGWICGAAYAWEFVLQPLLSFALAVGGAPVDVTHLPKLDVSELSMVLMGMLGLGAMRSWDKKIKE